MAKSRSTVLDKACKFKKASFGIDDANIGIEIPRDNSLDPNKMDETFTHRRLNVEITLGDKDDEGQEQIDGFGTKISCSAKANSCGCKTNTFTSSLSFDIKDLGEDNCNFLRKFSNRTGRIRVTKSIELGSEA